MKLFIAGLANETNSFSPIHTGESSFRACVWHEGDATRHPGNHVTEPLIVWRNLAQLQSVDVIEGFFAAAEPGGIVPASDYESLRDKIVHDAKNAMPVDIILLNLHGSMIAEGYDDCEGDLLQSLREQVGEATVIGVELDLHCSITPQMLNAANAIITYKQYPHVDAKERARELFDICHATARGEFSPVMAVTDCKMISAWWTGDEPTKSFVAKMQNAENQNGILSVSFAHGFPWADVPHGAAKMLVIADKDIARAQKLSDAFARDVWDMRQASRPNFLDVDAALGQVDDIKGGPIVISDASDNAGGGAPSDSTYLLRSLLDHGLRNIAAGLFWDPELVEQCFQSGEGRDVEVALGGHFGAVSGEPLLLSVKIMALKNDATQTFGTSTNAIGRAVWIRLGETIDIVVNDLRTQTFHPDAFTRVGIDLDNKDLIMVKSSQHFRAGFEPIAKKIIVVTTPGTLNTNFASVPYKKRPRPWWPLDENPFDKQS